MLHFQEQQNHNSQNENTKYHAEQKVKLPQTLGKTSSTVT